MSDQSAPAAILLAMALFWAGAAGAATGNTLSLNGATPPPAKIEDLAWLAGYWRGTGLGGECEELWSQPVARRMLGSFALVRDGQLVFSEAMTLTEEAGSLVLKVRHYDAAFVGWEDKADYVRFPLVKTGDSVAWFDGLTFRRSAPDRLDIFLVLYADGEKTEHRFELQRVALE